MPPAEPSRPSRLPADSVQGPPQALSQGLRRELLRVTLRDTLRRHGIPLEWIGAEVLAGASREGQAGLHWQLVIRHWDPRLMVRIVPLQNSLLGRLHSVDPLASQWLVGVAWQVAVADESACPVLPHPGSWTSLDAAPRAGAPGAAAAGGSADVIEGPVRIEDTGDATRSELEHLLAARDADFLAHNGSGAGHEATQPMYLATQPAKL